MSLGSSEINDGNTGRDQDGSRPPTEPTPERSPAEIQDWMVSYLARELNQPQEEIDVTVPFENFALDSAAAIAMTGDLEEYVGQPVDPMLVYDYPTIKDMAQYLGSDGAAENDL